MKKTLLLLGCVSLLTLTITHSPAFAKIKWPDEDKGASQTPANIKYLCDNVGKYFDRDNPAYGSNIDCPVKVKEYGKKSDGERKRLQKYGCGEWAANSSNISEGLQRANVVQTLAALADRDTVEIFTLYSSAGKNAEKLLKEDKAKDIKLTETGEELFYWLLWGYQMASLTNFGCNITVDLGI